MNSTRIVPILVAACLVASTSCSESTAPTASSSRSRPISRTPSLVTVSGTIHLGYTDMGDAYLATSDGDNVLLVGSETVNLAGLDGAEVDVRGSWADGAFALSDFLVRRVGGVEVLDGVLTTVYDEETGEAGYGLDLTGGSLVSLIDPPEELLVHIGQRVWVTEPSDGLPMVFGVIGPQTE